MDSVKLLALVQGQLIHIPLTTTKQAKIRPTPLPSLTISLHSHALKLRRHILVQVGLSKRRDSNTGTYVANKGSSFEVGKRLQTAVPKFWRQTHPQKKFKGMSLGANGPK